ncbi:MAG TPA: T9SS type A sorting domain-containing protein, partial [Flavobacteriales bacterium]|nr:T9SS type A sorting domain-containing protein [Flavobacteriales bacterium]
DCGSDTIQTTINVIKIVGIEDVNANQLKFYPNPVQDQISIHNPWKNNQLVQVNMYDSVGKLVLKNTSNDSLIQLSLKDLAPGIYYLQLVQGQTILKSRFVHTR